MVVPWEASTTNQDCCCDSLLPRPRPFGIFAQEEEEEGERENHEELLGKQKTATCVHDTTTMGCIRYVLQECD